MLHRNELSMQMGN